MSLVFNQLHCHGNSSHRSQNTRINTSVVNLDSCKKLVPKLKKFKSNDELSISTWKLCSATLNCKCSIIVFVNRAHLLFRYGRPNIAIFNSYYVYSILYSMFNYLFNIQLLFSIQCFSSTQLIIQYSIIYSMFNFLFNIQWFIQCSTFYSTFNLFNIFIHPTLIIYSTFNFLFNIQLVIQCWTFYLIFNPSWALIFSGQWKRDLSCARITDKSW